MRKILFILLAILIISAVSYLVYLNEIVLPVKIKKAVVESLSRTLDKPVSMSGARIDIFRGLVLKDLRIGEENSNILYAKDISARFLLAPLLKKQVIITSLTLDSPEISVERLPDNTIDIITLFFDKLLPMKGDYSLAVSRVIISRGSINFKDDTLEPALTTILRSFSFDAHISLPNKIVFEAESEIQSRLPAHVECSGEYKIRDKELSLDMKARDLYVKEFDPYFKSARIELPDGRIDAVAKIIFKDNILEGQVDMTSLSLIFLQGKINADLNCDIKAKIKYDLNKKELIYSGETDMKNLALSGLDHVDKINDIRGKVIFSEKKLSSDNITCTVLGLPLNAKIELPNGPDAVMKTDINTDIDLKALDNILKDKFNINIPAGIEGAGKFNVSLQYKLSTHETVVINGSMVTADAALKTAYIKEPLKNIKGKFKFTHNQLTWTDAKFQYLGADYNASGMLTNFEKPGLSFELYSDKLELQSLLAINDKIITVSKFDGEYGALEFSIQGNINTTDPSNMSADIKGSIKFGLSADNVLLEKFKDIIKSSKASGMMTSSFSLKGNLNDMAHSSIDAEVSSSSISLYGFKMSDFKMRYMQRNGIMDIINMHSLLYGGTLGATGRIDLISKDMPYQINAEAKGIKIESIKNDTTFKNNNVSGSLDARFGIKGFSNDSTRLNGWGKISIMNGKLWELNLLHGIGAILFKSDFSSVMFKEGSCSFSVRDKAIFTNDLVLKSDLLNLYGTVKIGFDKLIYASLKTEFTDEGIDAGNMSDMAGAIERYSIIEVKGDLKDPKYKIRPDLSNVISDVADNFFKQ